MEYTVQANANDFEILKSESMIQFVFFGAIGSIFLGISIYFGWIRKTDYFVIGFGVITILLLVVVFLMLSRNLYKDYQEKIIIIRGGEITAKRVEKRKNGSTYRTDYVIEIGKYQRVIGNEIYDKLKLGDIYADRRWKNTDILIEFAFREDVGILLRKYGFEF
ncbi:hypothetical protein [Leptospira sp. 'Mane']|uniref:hypothetical protein n=1 Tax=Leptospira sp. 'Mane' TaxID=3387407 RepID=UPI00398B35C1